MRFSKVDSFIIEDHSYLTPFDECLFLREYIRSVGYSGGETNSLISNFKKGRDRQGRPEWHYKERAINKIARELANALNPEWIKIATLVPIPPSKIKQNPLYDDRMTQVLNQVPTFRGVKGDIRELIVQTVDMIASHTSDERPSPEEIERNYTLDENLTSPTPKAIGLFDDLLTTGAHFRAASSILASRFPGVPIIGVFVARRIKPEMSSKEEN